MLWFSLHKSLWSAEGIETLFARNWSIFQKHPWTRMDEVWEEPSWLESCFIQSPVGSLEESFPQMLQADWDAGGTSDQQEIRVNWDMYQSKGVLPLIGYFSGWFTIHNPCFHSVLFLVAFLTHSPSLTGAEWFDQWAGEGRHPDCRHWEFL